MKRYTGELPGASLLVVKDGKPIIRRGFGYADLETRMKAGPETNYRMASVSKQFTAASILLLKQDGKLRLEDPVRKYLPELPGSDDKITIYHLLMHSGGLIDYEDLVPADRTTQLDDADVLSLIAAQHRLYFELGTAFRYSNGGYVLLGLIVQRVSGMDLADFMKTPDFPAAGYERDTDVRTRAWPGGCAPRIRLQQRRRQMDEDRSERHERHARRRRHLLIRR